MLWRWAKRIHPNKSSQWIKDKYWIRKDTRDWIFTNGENTLILPTDIPIVRHKRLKLDKNPYTDKEYFSKEKRERTNCKETSIQRDCCFQI
jgi:RNA-directed DNA polymerase